MCVSQDAAGLACYVNERDGHAHQVLMMSERMIACNENAEMARSMDTWPIGRSLIYGIGFTKEGNATYQQPDLPPGAFPLTPFHIPSKQSGRQAVWKTSEAGGVRAAKKAPDDLSV